MQSSKLVYFLTALLGIIILYPKFPLLFVNGSFVAVRLEDFIIAGIAVFWLVMRAKSISGIFSLPVHRAIMLYLFVGLVAVFSGIFLTKTATLNQGLLHLFRRVEYFIPFFIAYDLLIKKEQLNYLLKSLLVISFCVALYGLGQQFFGLPVISTTNSEFSKGLALSLGPGARINSTFAGHYDLAAFSLFPLFCCLGLLTLKIKHKWAVVLVGGSIYWSMLLSASRVTFAAAFLCAGLFLLLLRKKIWLIPLGIIAILSILATPQLAGRYRELILNHLVLVPSVYAQETSIEVTPADKEIPDTLKPSAQPEDRSLNIRLQAEWPRAFRAITKNPFLGTGFSSVGLAVDNDYLRLLAETGIFGLAAFLLIIIRLVKTFPFKFIINNPSSENIFLLAILFGLFGIMINALFIDVFEASKIAITLWLLLGILEKSKKWA